VNDLPDRTDHRQPDHRQMRVSDADRDRVADVLREATGQGRLTFDELEERIGRTYAAKTYADLDEITRDLPVTASASHPVPAPAAGRFPPARMGGEPRNRLALAVMSGARRAGRWVVPRRFTAVAVMGGVELDLRHARFSEPEVTIQAYALMGGVSIVTGDDIEVDVSGVALMGGFDHHACGSGLPGAPRVRVVGFALMGGVDVQRKPAQDGETAVEGGGRPSITG
jgi:uncharacterized protein DUF1707